MGIKDIFLGLLFGICLQHIQAMEPNVKETREFLDSICLQLKKGCYPKYAITEAERYCNSQSLPLRKRAFCIFEYLVQMGEEWEQAALLVHQEPCKDVMCDFMECQYLNLRLSLIAVLVSVGQELELAHKAVQRWLPSQEKHPTNFMLDTKHVTLKIYQALEEQSKASEELAQIVQAVLKDQEHEYYHSRLKESILDTYILLVRKGIALERACQVARLGLNLMGNSRKQSLQLYAWIVDANYAIDEAAKVMHEDILEGKSLYPLYNLWITLRNQGITIFDKVMSKTFGNPK